MRLPLSLEYFLTQPRVNASQAFKAGLVNYWCRLELANTRSGRKIYDLFNLPKSLKLAERLQAAGFDIITLNFFLIPSFASPKEETRKRAHERQHSGWACRTNLRVNAAHPEVHTVRGRLPAGTILSS